MKEIGEDGEDSLKRIGLFGGTFNPIHFGHLRAAIEVKSAFALDTIYFIPSAIPPHKVAYGMAAAKDRLNMAQAALLDCPDMEASDVEINRAGLSFSIDTIQHFRTIIPTDSQLYFIIGMDAFLEIDTWKSFRPLFSLAEFIVMTRPGVNGCDLNGLMDRVASFLSSKISDRYTYSSSRSGFFHSNLNAVYPFEITLLDISSSKIRKLINSSRSIQFLLPSKIEAFIHKKGLYR